MRRGIDGKVRSMKKEVSEMSTVFGHGTDSLPEEKAWQEENKTRVMAIAATHDSFKAFMQLQV